MKTALFLLLIVPVLALAQQATPGGGTTILQPCPDGKLYPSGICPEPPGPTEGDPIPLAGSYFIDSDADTGGDGTFANPWDSTVDANNFNFVTGNDVYLKAGTVYALTAKAQSPWIDWGGTAQNHVIYGCYYEVAGEGFPRVCTDAQTRPLLQPTVKFTGINANAFIIGANLSYIDIVYIEADGVEYGTVPLDDDANPARYGRWLNTENNSNTHITLDGVKFSHAVGYNCIQVHGTDYFTAKNSEFDHCGSLRRIRNNGVDFDAGGDCIRVGFGSEYSLIENNYFTHCAHNSLSIQSNYSVIRYNTFDNGWDDVFEVGSGYRLAQLGVPDWQPAPNGRFVVEHNWFKRIGEPGGISGQAPWSKFHTKDSIYRFNKYSNDDTGSSNSYGWNFQTCCGTMTYAAEQHIYNNDVREFLSNWINMRTDYNAGVDDISDNVFKNNVVGENIGGDPRYFVGTITDREDPSDPWDGNTFVDNCFLDSVVEFQVVDPYFRNTIATAETQYPQRFYGNQTGDTCTATNQGADLTVTLGNGNTNILTVADAKYFTDGHGLIDGDIIDIGGNTRIVEGVDYTNNRLTLDSAIQWTAGLPVNLACNTAVKHGLVDACGTPGFGGVAPPTGPPVEPPDPTPGVLTVSTDGRRLENGGQPFFWTAGTIYYLNSLSEADITYYLNNRQAKGFNTVIGPTLLRQVYGAAYPAITDYTDLQADFNGNQPLTSDSPVTLNNAFWNHIDYIVAEADARGMILALPIMWGFNLDLLFSKDAPGNAQAYALGEAIATRYAAYDNIVWFVLGEYEKIAWDGASVFPAVPDAAELALIRALADGIADNKGANQLMTIHAEQTMEEFASDAWLDFYQYQSFTSTAFSVDFAQEEYAYTPTRPVIQMEPGYEGFTLSNPAIDAWMVRVQAWTGALSGSAGIGYGAFIGFYFDPALDWKTAIDQPGSEDVVLMKTLMESYSWELLEPAQSMVVVGEGSAGGQTYVAAAKASDGTFAVVYSSKGGTFSLDLTSMTLANMEARWFNPRTGEYTFIGYYANTLTSLSFNPPGNPLEDNDWVLVLDAI